MVREVCEECEVVEFEICFTKGLSQKYEAALFYLWRFVLAGFCRMSCFDLNIFGENLVG